MKCKNYFLITLLVVIISSCKNLDNRVSQQEAPLPIQPSAKNIDSATARIGNPEAKDYKNRLHNIIERMNKGFSSVPTTGNPEDDFSKLMITNHFAGIEMCELHLKAGQDSSLKAVARKKIALLQNQEDYFDDYQFNSASGYRSPVKKTIPAIKHLKMADAWNKDMIFAHIISEYNLNTIELAREYLQQGTNAVMRKNAQKLIQNFLNEEQQLKKILKTQKIF